MKSAKFLMIRTLASVAIAIFSISLMAQQQQSFLDEPGVPAFTTAFAVENGFINIPNGALHLEIPIGTYTQRGSKLQYHARLVYDSRFWTYDGNPDDSPHGWQPNGVSGYPQPFGVGWRLITGGEPGTPSMSQKLLLECSTGSAGQIGPFYKTQLSKYQYQEPDGTVHRFPSISLTRTDINCGFAPGPGTASALASDNSGFRMDVSNFTSIVVHAPDGTKVYPTVQDSNGNFFTENIQTISGVGFVDHVVDTLGREPVIASFSGNPVSQVFLDYLNPQGARSRATVTLVPINLATQFGTGGDYTGTLSAVQSIFFPDGSSYQFQYDSYGQITSVTLPTGGQVTYGYTNTQGNRWLTSRIVDDNTWIFTPSFVACAVPCNPVTVTVTTPTYSDGTTTASDNHVYSFFFASLNGGSGAWLTQVQHFRGAASGTPILTLTKEYNSGQNNSCQLPMGNALTPVLIRETLTWPAASGTLSKKAEYCYDTNGVNLISTKMWDYQPNGNFGSAPEREIDNVPFTDPAYINANILQLPLTITSLAAGGVQTAKTTYAYDGGTLQPANIATNHTTPAGPRGNLTSVSKWLNTTGGSVTSSTQWFDTGEIYKSLDPLGHTTTFAYDAANAGAYVTQACNALSPTQCSYSGYNFNTGLLTTSTDINGASLGDAQHTTTYTYDSMLRPLCTNKADGGQTCLSYPSATTTTKTTKITLGLSDISSQILDGLGRVSQAQHLTPAGTAKVDTTYDPLGRVSIVSNPYFTTADPTYGITQSFHDAFGRTVKTVKQDGSPSSAAYSVRNSATVNGTCVTSTDEAGNKRTACHNGFGELREVDEPGALYPGAQAAGSIDIGPIKTAQVGGTTANPASAQVTISGADHFKTTIIRCTALQIKIGCEPSSFTTYDNGKVFITIGGHEYDYFFSGSDTSVDTSASVAQGLVFAIQGDAARLVNASVPQGGTVITLNAVASGTSSNGISFTTGYTWNTNQFPTQSPSFTSSPTSGTLAGGQDGVPSSTVTDHGTVTLGAGSFTTAGVSYGPGTANPTAASVATSLASALSVPGSGFTAFSNGGTGITITATAFAASGNGVSVAAHPVSSDPTDFPSPSFSVGSTALNGGADPDPSGLTLPFVTLYGYDALGNLLRVNQKGSAPSDPTQWRTRLFTYNSLSQLLTATNPESGTISYSYDADGNLVQRTSPQANQTGSVTTTFTYCYDALNRLLAKGFVNSPQTPQQCTTTSPWLPNPTVVNTFDQGTNSKGRLSSLTDQAGTGIYMYDNLGRMATETRSLIGANSLPVSKTMAYTYNLDSSIKTLTYPSNTVITYAPWNNGTIAVSTPQEAKDLGNGINYATGGTYGADGSLTGFVSGNSGAFTGISNKFIYTPRLQPCRMAAATGGTLPANCADTAQGNILDLGYDFHLGNGITGADNGNVYGVTNYKDQTRNQSFGYDLLNRLTSAQNSGTDCSVLVLQNKTKFWGNSYVYDAWGNLLQKNVTKCVAENLSITADNGNRIHASGTDYQYDAAGNMTFNATSGQSYIWDQENRLSGATGYTYSYDEEGNRVRRSNGNTASSGTLYWYTTPGVVAESDLAGTLKSEYIFFAGMRVARKDLPGNTFAFYFSNNVKSTSVISDTLGNITEEYDYDPWGNERQLVNNDVNHYKFGGKERDSETQLDYFGARFDFSSLSRFMSVDTGSLHLNDPRSLNRYSYALNNPLRYVDPDGKAPLPASITLELSDFYDIRDRILNQRLDEYRNKIWADPPGLDDFTKSLRHAGVAVMKGASIFVHDEAGISREGIEEELASQILTGTQEWLKDPTTTLDDLKASLITVSGLLHEADVPPALSWIEGLDTANSLLQEASLSGTRNNTLKLLERMIEDEIKRREEEEKKKQEEECKADPSKCGKSGKK